MRCYSATEEIVIAGVDFIYNFYRADVCYMDYTFKINIFRKILYVKK